MSKIILVGRHRDVPITYDGKVYTHSAGKAKRLTLDDAVTDIDVIYAGLKHYKVLVIREGKMVRAQADECIHNRNKLYVSGRRFMWLHPKKETFLDTPSNRVALGKIVADKKEHEQAEAILIKALEHVK